MTGIRVITVGFTVVMCVAIAAAAATGDFNGEGSWILDDP
jgi:hypothetical protein